MTNAQPHRAGTISIIGQPNTGKSTLLNRVLGERVAIVSRKPQTTRTRVLGVAHNPAWQLAFLDTPGIHASGGAGLGRYMVEQAYGTLQEVDLVLLVVDASQAIKRARSGDGAVAQGGSDPQANKPVEGSRVQAEDMEILERVKAAEKPMVLALNKVDLCSRPELLPLIDSYQGLAPWRAIHPISAQSGEGVSALLSTLGAEVPESPPLFPPDMLTDQAERSIAAEYVREQVLRFTHKEVPYATAIEVTLFDEEEREGRGLVRIEANVVVERESQKGIVIGKGGAMLRRIGTAARMRLESFLGVKVFLGLTVKVEPDWSKRPAGLQKMGYQ